LAFLGDFEVVFRDLISFSFRPNHRPCF